DDDVVRLEIAVDDSLGVRGCEGVGELNRQLQDAPRMKRTAADHRLQRFAGNVLEDEVRAAVVLADLVQRGDVGMRERHGGPRLPQDLFAAGGNRRHRVRQELDRNGSAEPCVARPVDFPDAAAPERREDLVVFDGFAHERDDYNCPAGAKRARHKSDAHRPLNPYFALLRRNRNFRLLYIGQTISQLGDWFNAVAVYALLLDLTGSATAVAWMMIVQYLPVALVSPLAGVTVDRVDRRRLMIATDLLRGCVILGLLIVRRVDQVWIAYTVMA